MQPEDIFSELHLQHNTPSEQPQDPPTEPAPLSDLEDNRISAYVDFLKENDLIELPEDIETVNSANDLQRIFAYTRDTRTKKAVESLMETLPSDFQPLLEYALTGGSSIQEYYNNFVADPLSNVDITNEDTQKEILKAHYKETSKFSDDKINRLISLLGADGDLQTHAEEALTELQEMRSSKQQAFLDAQKLAQEKQQEDIKNRTTALVGAIDASPVIHSTRRSKVKSMFFDPFQAEGQTTTKFNYIINAILNNPEHQAQLGDLLLEYDPASGFSAERLQKKASTKANQEFNKALNAVLETNRPPKKQEAPEVDFWNKYIS